MYGFYKSIKKKKFYNKQRCLKLLLHEFSEHPQPQMCVTNILGNDSVSNAYCTKNEYSCTLYRLLIKYFIQNALDKQSIALFFIPSIYEYDLAI